MLNKRYNSVAFTPEEVNQGLHTDLITYLVNYNAQGKSDDYYEIHITSDGYCMIIEFDKVPNNHAFGGTFKYVDESDGDIVMKEYIFPDNHTELCYNEDDYKERLDTFLKENPGWVKNSYNCWTNELENEEVNQEVEQQHSLDFED